HADWNANRQSTPDSNSYADSYANRMYKEMLTDTEAVSDFGWATYSSPAFDTAACCFAERDPGAAAHSSASPHSAAYAHRFAASYPAAAPVEIEKANRL